MDRDIRKNIVDESGKNSDNIVDIEAFAADYEADAEFENLIKNGLEESWDDLGLSVSDDLIARTMDAIRNADASKKAFPGDKPEEAPKAAPAPVKVTKFNFRRIARIAAGIAAAALIGIVGIGVLKNGLFMKKSADATMNASGSSAPMAADTAEDSNSGMKNKAEAPATTANSAKSTESFLSGDQITQDLSSANGYYIADSAYTAATDDNYDGGAFDLPEADESGDESAGIDSFIEDILPTAAMQERQDMKTSEILEGTDIADNVTAGALDITAFGFESDEQYNTVKDYIESVRGELLGTGTDSDYIADENELLYRAAWPETDAGSIGLITICDIYQDRMVCAHSSFLSHIEPSHEVEEYALEDGAAVAEELRRLFGDEE